MHEDEVIAISALKAGNISGLEALVHRYQLPALRMAYNLCGDRELTEDAVSDAFLALQRHIETFDTARPFQSWFYRIVVNCIRSSLRRDHRLPIDSDASDRLWRHADPGPLPEMHVVQGELEAALLQQIDALPEKQREVINLRYYLDMDGRSMSDVLDVPLGTVKWRLFQARKRLRRQFSEGHQIHTHLSPERHGS